MLKQRLILTTARALGAAARRTGRGGGTALPGLLIERAAPDLISQLARQLDAGAVLVSGTNGKTTTARLIARVLEHAGYHVTHNRAGSNLVRGIAAALAQGEQAPAAGPRIGLFEVDEATLPEAIRLLQPRAIVLLNLFRDQLDRYGEIDTIAHAWSEALAGLPPDTRLVLNADDPLVAALGRDLPAPARYFGVEDTSHAQPEREAAADFVECLDCTSPFDYTASFYGHLGHYRCPACGWTRPTPELAATAVETPGLSGITANLESDREQVSVTLALPGLYNVYNLLAAAATARALDIPLVQAAEALTGFRAVFGRGERLTADGQSAVMLLTKNPVGANQVLRVIAAEPGPKALLLALNDYTADGEDVSWIWDVDYDLLRGQARWVVAAGRRATDLALRLKHAGWFEPPNAALPLTVLPGLEHAVRTAFYRLAPGQTLYILPTYTAMLELRAVLARMGITRPFWEDA